MGECLGEEGLDESFVGDVGEGGSTGPDDFFTLELRARLGGMLSERRRVCNATTITVIRRSEKTSRVAGKKEAIRSSHANFVVRVNKLNIDDAILPTSGWWVACGSERAFAKV